MQAAKARKDKEVLYEEQKKAHAGGEAECCKMVKGCAVQEQGIGLSNECTMLRLLDPITLLNRSHFGLQMLDKEIEAASNFLEPVIYTVITKDFYERRHVNLPIAEMGNYTLCLESKKALRDPHLSDAENLRNAEVYFGNPYKKSNDNQVIDEKALESELMQSKVHSITLLKEEELSAKNKTTQKTSTLLDDEESEMKMNDIEVKHKEDVQEKARQKSMQKQAATLLIKKTPNEKPVVKKSKDEKVGSKKERLEESKEAELDNCATAKFYASCYPFKRSKRCTTLTVKRPRERTVDGIRYYYYLKKFFPCTFAMDSRLPQDME